MAPHSPLTRHHAWIVGVPAFYLLAAVVMTFPLILHLDDRIVGDAAHPAPKAELALEFMTLSELERANVPRFYQTTTFNYPAGQDMGPRIGRSMNLVAFLPFGLLLPLLPAHNVYVLFLLAATGVAVYLLARSQRLGPPAALVSGLFFLFSAYVALKLDMGFVQKSFYVWLPLALLFALRVVDHGKPRDAVFAGVMLFLMYITYAIYAAWALILVGLLGIYALVFRRDWRAAALLGVAVAIMGALSAVVDLVYAQPTGYLIAESTDKAYQGVTDPIAPWLLLRYYIDAPTDRHCGVSVIGLACGVFAAFRGGANQRFWLVAVAIFACFLFGTHIDVGRWSIPAPMFPLFEYFPVREAIYTPIRSLPVTLLLLALAVGWTVQWLTRSRPWRIRAAVVAAAMVLITAETRLLFADTFPVTCSEPGVSAFFEQTSDEEFEAYLHLPMIPQEPRNNDLHYHYELRTALAGKRMANQYMNTSTVYRVPGPAASTEFKDQFVAQLSHPGIRYVVYHERALRNVQDMHERLGLPQPAMITPDEIAWLADYCGEPVRYDDTEILVYEIPPPDKAPELPDLVSPGSP